LAGLVIGFGARLVGSPARKEREKGEETMRKTTLALLVAAGTLAAASTANADVLWDQSAVDAGGAGFVDQAFPDVPDFSTYMVNDTSYAAASVITDITTYYTTGFGGWPTGAGTATVNVFTSLGAGDDPSAGTSVAVTYTNTGTGIEVHASGLNIAVAAGTTYWIGLTPELAFADFGQEFHSAAAAAMGDPSMARNPGGGFGVGTDWFDAGVVFGGVSGWDAAILIEGFVVPAPSAMALLGFAGLAGIRRRR
jgi:hypothetical protein